MSQNRRSGKSGTDITAAKNVSNDTSVENLLTDMTYTGAATECLMVAINGIEQLTHQFTLQEKRKTPLCLDVIHGLSVVLYQSCQEPSTLAALAAAVEPVARDIAVKYRLVDSDNATKAIRLTLEGTC